MIIRAGCEHDALAMGQVMVATYLAAHRDQMPHEAWAKRAAEWTAEESALGWVQTLREIAAGKRPDECIVVALDDGEELIGLAMAGLADAQEQPQVGAVYALYVDTHHQGSGVGRSLLHGVATALAQSGMTALQIGCLAANAPARAFYERLGGRLVGERLFDEDGVLLPEVVYGWDDIHALISGPAPIPGHEQR